MSKERMKFYIVDRVPKNMISVGADETVWYCHMDGFPNIPVFGSIGSKKKAEAVCRCYNLDGKVRYA